MLVLPVPLIKFLAGPDNLLKATVADVTGANRKNGMTKVIWLIADTALKLRKALA